MFTYYSETDTDEEQINKKKQEYLIQMRINWLLII